MCFCDTSFHTRLVSALSLICVRSRKERPCGKASGSPHSFAWQALLAGHLVQEDQAERRAEQHRGGPVAVLRKVVEHISGGGGQSGAAGWKGYADVQRRTSLFGSFCRSWCNDALAQLRQAVSSRFILLKL